jgi:hypothetical protein
VSEQEHRLVEVLHIVRVEEIRGLVSVDSPVTPFVHVEGHRRERVEEQELGSSVCRPALCSCLVQQLLQLVQVTEDAIGIAVRVSVDLCDAVGFGLFACGLAPLDESELTSCRHRSPPTPVRRHSSPAQKQTLQTHGEWPKVCKLTEEIRFYNE